MQMQKQLSKYLCSSIQYVVNNCNLCTHGKYRQRFQKINKSLSRGNGAISNVVKILGQLNFEEKQQNLWQYVTTQPNFIIESFRLFFTSFPRTKKLCAIRVGWRRHWDYCSAAFLSVENCLCIHAFAECMNWKSLSKYNLKMADAKMNNL